MVESGAWPWVGRGRELRQIVAAIDASHADAGVVLTGPRGVGKTRIAAEALKRCEGVEARWAAGTPAGRAVPLGAFADWLPDGVESPTHSTERVIAHLVGGAAPRSVVVVVVHLSVRTVEGHLYRAAGRVGARNRGELARTICDDLGDTG